MDSGADAGDYERLFLKKYFLKQFEEGVKKIEAEKSASSDPLKESKYNEKINQLKTELEAKLGLIEDNAPRADTQKTEDSLVPTADGAVVHCAGYPVPKYLWDYLFGYQRSGVEWMLGLFKKGKGGILADEMGLGKTIQTVVFLATLFESGSIRRVLILCPATVVSQWENEFRRIYQSVQIREPEATRDDGVRVMSYDRFKASELRQNVDIFILDEGHRIKNKDTIIAARAKSVRRGCQFILTGTPIQNNLSEMWSLFDFAVPGLLGTHAVFNEEFVENIRQRSNGDLSYRYSVMLRAIIEPYILRRTKAQVAHALPGRVDRVVFISLSPLQHNLYVKALESDRVQKQLNDKAGMLAAIDLLRKICNHPLLVSSERNKGYVDEAESAKIVAMLSLLEKWKKEGKRALVFVQTVQMLGIIEQVIINHSYSYLKMSGGTPVAQRNRLVDSFNKDSSVFLFLLTTRVGGVGLNLTGANRVILYDPDWNPATDSQAKERIYRFGQKSEVEIYRLITRNTIEEKIYQKQIYKDCLSKKILNDPSIRIDRAMQLDLFSYFESRDEGMSVEALGVPETSGDKLVDLREEDKGDFSILKDLGFKQRLSGRELINFIERREMNLNE